MGREAFRVKIAEIASRRGGGWSPGAACTWQSRRATSYAPDTLCLCTVVYLDGVLTLYSCYPSCTRLAPLFLPATGRRWNWTVDFLPFFFLLFFVLHFLQKCHTAARTPLSRHLVNVSCVHSLLWAFSQFFSMVAWYQSASFRAQRNWFGQLGVC